ncbi:hypothetical protein G6F57_015411 [Rhizopus arrhizus]|nr:hypothetical protein G6F57_015411 [Rhizopus arrhizus]
MARNARGWLDHGAYPWCTGRPHPAMQNATDRADGTSPRQPRTMGLPPPTAPAQPGAALHAKTRHATPARTTDEFLPFRFAVAAARSRPRVRRDPAGRDQPAHRRHLDHAAAGRARPAVRLRHHHDRRAGHAADRLVRAVRRSHAGPGATPGPGAHHAAGDGDGDGRPAAALQRRQCRHAAARFGGGTGRHGHRQRGGAAAGEALLRQQGRHHEHALHQRAAAGHDAAGAAGGAGGQRRGLAGVAGHVGPAGAGRRAAVAAAWQGLAHLAGLEHDADVRHDLADDLFDVHLAAAHRGRGRWHARLRWRDGGGVLGPGPAALAGDSVDGGAPAEPVPAGADRLLLVRDRLHRPAAGADEGPAAVGLPAGRRPIHLPAGADPDQSAHPHPHWFGGAFRLHAGPTAGPSRSASCSAVPP